MLVFVACDWQGFHEKTNNSFKIEMILQNNLERNTPNHARKKGSIMKNFPKGICDHCVREQRGNPPLKHHAIYYCPHHHVLSLGDSDGGWTIKIGVTPDRYSKQLESALAFA